MEVFKAALTDLDKIAELFDGYRQFYRQAPDKDKAKQFIADRMINEESHIYTCKNQQGEYLGFVQLYPLFSSVRMKRLWLLNDLFVAPIHRGKGVSKVLINRAKELAKETNASGLLLETEKSNTIGNQLYPSTGFKKYDETYFYFWENK